MEVPEEYDEIAASKVELLAVPKNLIEGASAKFVELMKKDAETERLFYAEQVQKKIGLMELMGMQHASTGGGLMGQAGTKAAMELHKALNDESGEGIGDLVHSLKQERDAAGGGGDHEDPASSAAGREASGGNLLLRPAR